MIQVILTLTETEAKLLNVATNELFHSMKANQAHEIYGALIVNENVLAARSLWNKVEELIPLKGWE